MEYRKRNESQCQKKCASLSLRGCFEGSLNGTALASAKNQRYLGVLKKNNLMWSLNCNTRLNKARRAFYFLKRNISKNRKLENKTESIYWLCTCCSLRIPSLVRQ